MPKNPISDANVGQAEAHIMRALQCLGVDTDLPHFVETPRRVMQVLHEYLAARPEPKWTCFDREGTGMVVQTRIPVVSMCEHHFLPFVGTATVGYIPNKKQLGLSKLARLVEWVSHRPQNQERLTSDILTKLVEISDPLGAGVIVRAHHTCMCVRGPRVPDSWTTTSELKFCFLTDSQTRQEFWNIHLAG